MRRLSALFSKTLRDDPADAELASHRLLVRAGYVRRVAPGIFTWLPLGLDVLRRIEAVVREEMEAIGGQEVLFPALVPKEHYATTGRWDGYGDSLFRLKDRRGGDYLLAPTHEELFTNLVKGEASSYKDLPLILFQLQTKYRDEARPRAGVLRGREFLMKDSYSFDIDDAGLAHSYGLHRQAYQRIFDRLGLEYTIVSAVSGAMGGSASEEFLAPAEAGEDTYVSCPACGYAANVEAALVAAPPASDPAERPAVELLDTPDTPTIATLVDAVRALGHDIDASATLKNVAFTLRHPPTPEHPAGRTETLVVGVPGDRDVDLRRLEANVGGATIEAADLDGDGAPAGLVKGYIGPQGLTADVRYVVDPLVVTGSEWVTGANRQGVHAAHVTMGRDFEPDGVLPAAEIRPGDACTRCGGPLELARGIEIGHIFQLGRKYTDAFSVDVLGPDGKPRRVTMGSYGIGVSRAVAAIAEQTHDERGLLWPAAVAPADVHVVAVGKADQLEVATRLAEELEAGGRRVLLDDRGASPGVAFKDAELLGVPVILVVGKGLAGGVVEVRDRRAGTAREVPVGEVVAELTAP